MGDTQNAILPLGSAPERDSFPIYTAKPLIRFLKQGVQPPSQVYVTVGDDIVVGCASSAVGESVTVSYRLLRADGELTLGQFVVRPAANRSITIHQESLAEGFLLSVSCKASVATTRGVTFVRVFLTDPSLGPGQPSYMLMSDYVTTAMAPAHPNGRQLAPVDGPGNVLGVTVPPPAQGLDWNVVVPTNARWKLISAVWALQTSAVAGVRLAKIILNTLVGAGFEGFAEAGPGPGTFAVYNASPTRNVPAAASNSFWLPLPVADFRLPGTGIGTNTLALDPLDQYISITLNVEEWLDNV